MPSTYTTSLQLEKQAYDENSNTWGARRNVDLDKVDQAVNGYITLSLSGVTSPLTLTFVKGQVDQATNRTFKFTGTLSGDFTVNFPAVPKVSIVENATSGGHKVIVSISSSTIAIPAGQRALVCSDGVLLYDGVNATISDFTVGGTLTANAASLATALPLGSGGTGATTQDAASINVSKSGMITVWPGAAAPTGWLPLDGSAVSRSTYATLYAALGGASSPWGQGDGVNTFNLPPSTGHGFPALTGFIYVIKA